MSLSLRRFRRLAAGCCVALTGSVACAAPPSLTFLYPAGGAPGTSFVVTAGGDQSTWPVQVALDRPGLTVTCEEKKGNLRVEAAKDAQPGLYWIRLYNEEGASPLRPLVLDHGAQVEEAEPNDKPSQPQPIEGSAVIHGRLEKSDDVDGFLIEVEAGQTLVASVQANSVLGSPMDSILQLCELVERPVTVFGEDKPPVEAFVLAQDHDATGLDPQIVWTAPRSGKFLVRVFAFPSQPNSSIRFSGGADYIYRLTLSTGAVIDHALPLAVTAEKATEVKLLGWNLPAEGSLLKLTGQQDQRQVTAAMDQAAGWANLPITNLPSILTKPSTAESPQEVELPVVVSGQLAEPAGSHHYRFTAAKGDKIDLKLESRSLGFPLDAVLEVANNEGQMLKSNDDGGRNEPDPVLLFVAPADGNYTVSIRDLHDRGGLRYAYRLTMQSAQADFSLALAGDVFTLEKEKPLEIPVTVNRANGFAEEISVSTVGLPDGVQAEAVVSEAKGDSSKKVTLKLTLGDGAPEKWSGPLRVTGTSQGDAGLTRTATFPAVTPLTEPQEVAWLTVGSATKK